MKKILWLSTILTGILFLAGCGTTASVQKDNNYDFSKIRTYAWVNAVKNKGDNASVKISDLTDRKIRESVNNQLQENGWKEVSSNPDVLLVYDVVIEKGEKNITTPAYSQPFTRWFYNPRGGRWVPVYYPSQIIGYDNSVQRIREGTLTLTLSDAETDKTIWQGWTTSEVNGRRLTEAEIDSKVKAIVKKLTRR